MALLRRSFGACAQTARLFATEVHTMPLDIGKFTKTGKTLPVTVIKQNDFIINKLLAEKKVLNESDFVTVREDLLASKDFRVTEDNVDMLMVKLCSEQQRMDTAMVYLEYLWKKHHDMNLSAISSYLKLCYSRDRNEFMENELEHLLMFYDTIRKKYPLLDAGTAECCILGISKTHRWKETFELCDMIKLSGNLRSRTYSAIICAAFKNDEPDIAWKYLREAFGQLHPEHYVFEAHIKYCTKHFKGKELEKEMEKMFQLWIEYDYRAFVDVVEAYGQVFKTLGWTIGRTTIRDVGVCRFCDHRLSKFKVSIEEFSKLAELIRKHVIISDDIYKKSTPKELKYFLQFVQQKKPWDIVIDGLNVSYLSKVSRKSCGHVVTSTVKLCAEQMGKKVLLLGRNHMRKWPNLDMAYIKYHADIFFTADGSADDPYLLYATLSSGPSTMFVSRDLMRQHVALLDDPETRSVFKKWQMTHQLSPVAVTSKQGTLAMKMVNPPKNSPIVQRDENGWHVPFTFEASLQPAVEYEPPKSWYCFRRTHNTVKSTNSSLFQ